MVYLIHFDKPFGHARHYMGWTSNLDARIAHHRAGTGARLMAVVTEAGIAWRVVRVWKDGDRHLERRLKNQGSHKRKCPVCNESIKILQQEGKGETSTVRVLRDDRTVRLRRRPR